jgi:NAD(P)-dependent dehydrogenase (short-subunit alcohol dehydrogenase family)
MFFSTTDMNDDKRKIAQLTAGNRGLGYETCRQSARFGLKVLLGACDLTKGKSAAYQLYEKEGLDVMFYQLDVSNQKSVYSMAKEVNQCFGRLDVFVNTLLSSREHARVEIDIID